MSLHRLREFSPAKQAGAVHDTTEKNMVDNCPPLFCRSYTARSPDMRGGERYRNSLVRIAACGRPPALAIPNACFARAGDGEAA